MHLDQERDSKVAVTGVTQGTAGDARARGVLPAAGGVPRAAQKGRPGPGSAVDRDKLLRYKLFETKNDKQIFWASKGQITGIV